MRAGAPSERRQAIEPREFFLQLGAAVRETRESHGLTQKAFGQLVGLSRPSVANLEAGRQRVSAYTLVVIMDRFEILLPYVDPPPGEDYYLRERAS